MRLRSRQRRSMVSSRRSWMRLRQVKSAFASAAAGCGSTPGGTVARYGRGRCGRRIRRCGQVVDESSGGLRAVRKKHAGLRSVAAVEGVPRGIRGLAQPPARFGRWGEGLLGTAFETVARARIQKAFAGLEQPGVTKTTSSLSRLLNRVDRNSRPITGAHPNAGARSRRFAVRAAAPGNTRVSPLRRLNSVSVRRETGRERPGRRRCSRAG